MVRTLLIGAALVAGVLVGALTAPPAHAGLDVAAAEQQFLDLLNADRVAHGLSPLQADQRLMDLARWRSEDMLARNYLSHDIGGYNVVRLLNLRPIDFALAGENVTVNTFDETQTVAVAEADLMASPPHRANILRPEFNLVGVGIAAGASRRTIYTQLFLQG